MARTLADLQGAFKTSGTNNFSSSNYYPFHLMPVDAQAVVRFLPDKNQDNPMGFLVEKVVHKLQINGKNRSVPCLSTYGEDCPVCAVSQQYYKANDEANGKKYWKKKQHIAQVLVIEDPMQADTDTGENSEGKVRFINIGYQLFNIIKNVFESGDLEEIPFAYEGGYNFIIKKQQQGEYATYALGSQFARRQTDLTADQIAYVEETIVDLSTLLPTNPGLAKVEALLNSALTGEEFVDPAKDNSSGGASSFAAQVQKVAAKKETVIEATESDDPPVTPDPVEKAEPAATTSSSDDLDPDDILAKIRNRRKAKAT